MSPSTRSVCGTNRTLLTLALLLFGVIGSMQGQVTGCIAYTLNYPCVYVVNSASNTVSVISSTTNTIIGPPVTVGTTPMGAAITPDNRWLYVVNHNDETVSIIDTTTNTPTTVVPLLSGTANLGNPTQVAITPDGTAAYVVGFGFVAVINTATQNLDPTRTITGLNNPSAIAFSPDGTLAYISDSCTGTGTACVDVLDTSTHLINQAAGTPIQIPGSVPATYSSVAVTSDGKLICVSVNDANSQLGIAFITASNNTYLSTLSLNVASSNSDYGIAIAPSGILYAAEPGSNEVAVVDTSTQTLMQLITVGNSPTGIAATSDGAQVYVSNATDDSVSVINTQTQTVTDTPKVQTGPAGVAVMPTLVQPLAVFQGQPTNITISITGPPGLQATFSCPTVIDSDGNAEQASVLGFQCSSDPPIITFTGAPQKVTIGIQTTGPALGRLFPAARPRSRLYASWFSPLWMVLPLVILCAGDARRPRPFPLARVRLAALPVALGLLASCGGGFSPTKPSQATPAGTYQLTIVDEAVGQFPGFVPISLVVPLNIIPVSMTADRTDSRENCPSPKPVQSLTASLVVHPVSLGSGDCQQRDISNRS